MNHLLRQLAPISDEGWDLLDEEARQQVTVALAARRLVDFKGPNGWHYSATSLGRAGSLPSAVEGVSALQRVLLPLVELRAEFTVARATLDDIDRGAKAVDLGGLDRAARQVAIAENVAVFYGWQGAFGGIADASPHPKVALGASPADYPARVATAVQVLLASGVSGPYGIALGPDQYRLVSETTEHGGYSLSEHLAKIAGGPLVRAPGVSGALVVSLRGGDFVFECGQDLSIGYSSRDGEGVRLYLEESFSFHVVTPEAAVTLHP